MVSSDMEEVVELADRAVTVFQGRINGEFSREEITQDALTSASFGIAQRGRCEENEEHLFKARWMTSLIFLIALFVITGIAAPGF